MIEGTSLELGAEWLVAAITQANPEHRKEIALQTLRAVKLVAYEEMLVAAKFHAGPHGQRIDGMVAGLERAIDSQRH